MDDLDRRARQKIKRRLKRGNMDTRQPPDFIIIGAQKGGTTSLYRYLTEHPDVGGATKKEVHYFDRNFDKGLGWYLAHFPKRDEFEVVVVEERRPRLGPFAMGRVGYVEEQDPGPLGELARGGRVTLVTYSERAG